jgi:hypothetical protein
MRPGFNMRTVIATAVVALLAIMTFAFVAQWAVGG